MKIGTPAEAGSQTNERVQGGGTQAEVRSGFSGT